MIKCKIHNNICKILLIFDFNYQRKLIINSTSLNNLKEFIIIIISLLFIK